MKKFEPISVTLEKIIGGGQALGTAPDGRKLFAWAGLPGEQVMMQPTRMKSSYIEGIVSDVITPSSDRITPKDPESYLATSPWQIMNFDAEQRYKSSLIEEAFALHQLTLSEPSTIYTDGQEYHYRNKVEFSWYGETDPTSGVDTLHLAFFRRGSKGKIIVNDSALLPLNMVQLARGIRDMLQTAGVTARTLKTLLIRADQKGNCVWQLYVKDMPCVLSDILMGAALPAQGGEIIYSNPKSPASVITKRLASTGNLILEDTILGVPFRYVAEGFFQVNLPVYEKALEDIRQWVPKDKETVDLYSGVGSIGLTVGGENTTLVEINEHAVREMERNIKTLEVAATPVLAASEHALEYITSEKVIIVDPPRAGLHADVITRLLEVKPPRIIYLSCNPVTQARDIALLSHAYALRDYKGYNFFPRTPHIEGLAILDRTS